MGTYHVFWFVGIQTSTNVINLTKTARASRSHAPHAWECSLDASHPV